PALAPRGRQCLRRTGAQVRRFRHRARRGRRRRDGIASSRRTGAAPRLRALAQVGIADPRRGAVRARDRARPWQGRPPLGSAAAAGDAPGPLLPAYATPLLDRAARAIQEKLESFYRLGELPSIAAFLSPTAPGDRESLYLRCTEAGEVEIAVTTPEPSGPG